jgi:hypothetical protein
MSSSLKLTRQGVRDLDFGWKKKPTVQAVPDAALAAVIEDQRAAGVGEAPAVGALTETADQGTSPR